MTMGENDDPADGAAMTLAFDVRALDEFLNPRAVVDDASRWSRHVGIIGRDEAAVARYVDRYDLRQDFELGPLDRRSVLSKLRWEANTPRFVFVGTTATDRALADHVGWEYLPVEEAAAKADWTLEADANVPARVRASLRRLWPAGIPRPRSW